MDAGQLRLAISRAQSYWKNFVQIVSGNYYTEYIEYGLDGGSVFACSLIAGA